MTRAGFAALLITAIWVGPGAAQSPVAKLAFADRPRLVRCGEQPCFRILVDASDAAGGPTDLPLDARVYRVVNLRSKQPIPVFYAAPLIKPGTEKAAERPVYSLFLFDLSGSMNEPVGLGETRYEAAVRVLRRFATEWFNPEVSRWAIVGFHSRDVVASVQGARFAETRTDVLNQISQLAKPAPRNNTALFSSVDAALQILTRKKDAGYEARLFVLTDGKNEVYPEKGDDVGLLGPDGLEIVEQAADQRRIEIITIGFGAPGDKGFDEAALRALAWPNQGNYHTAEAQEGLARVFETVQKQLYSRVQLTIGPIAGDKNQLTSSIPMQVTVGGRAVAQDDLTFVPPPLTPVFEGVIAGAEQQAFAATLVGPARRGRLAVRRVLTLGIYVVLFAVAWFVLPRVFWPRRYRRTPRTGKSRPSDGTAVSSPASGTEHTRFSQTAGARLEMLEGDSVGFVFPLAQDRVTIGRHGGDADWPIHDDRRKLSRCHCEVTRNGKEFFLTDRSTNGTSINGQRIPQGEPVRLQKKDRIELGDVVTLIFR